MREKNVDLMFHLKAYVEFNGPQQGKELAKAIIFVAMGGHFTAITDKNGTVHELDTFGFSQRQVADRFVRESRAESIIMGFDLLAYSQEKLIDELVAKMHEDDEPEELIAPEPEPEPEPVIERVRCKGCGEIPENLPEYRYEAFRLNMTPTEYVRREEGTYNPKTGRFYCSRCYIHAGMPLGTADEEGR